MKMKNVLLAVMLVLSLLAMTSCGTPDNASHESDQGEVPSAFDDAPVTATLLQGSPSGLWFMLSNGIAECLNQEYPGTIIQITPGSVETNVTRMVNGEADFILTHNNIAIDTMRQLQEQAEPSPGVVGIAAFYPSPSQLVLRSNLGVETLDEIIENKIPITLSVGAVGSAMDQTFYRVLEQYGTTKEEMEGWGCEFVSVSLADVGQRFADKAVDGYFVVVSSPAPVIVENALNEDMVLISYSDEVIDAMCENYGYDRFLIPKETYSFLSQDYETFTGRTILATTDTISDEVGYKMAKAIYENLDYIKLIYASLKDLTAESMVGDIKIPMHPGAALYYKEVGLID